MKMTADDNRDKPLIEEIADLRLREYDWDGCGGLPLRSDVADTLADFFADRLSGVGGFWRTRDVLMSNDGTVEIEYEHDNNERKLLINVRCEGVMTYVKFFEDDQTRVEGTIRFDVLDPRMTEFEEFTELFDWLAAETGED